MTITLNQICIGRNNNLLYELHLTLHRRQKNIHKIYKIYQHFACCHIYYLAKSTGENASRVFTVYGFPFTVYNFAC